MVFEDQVRTKCNQVGTKWDQWGPCAGQVGTNWGPNGTEWGPRGKNTNCSMVLKRKKAGDTFATQQHVDYSLILIGLLQDEK